MKHTVIIFLLAGLLFMPGCGKKGPPSLASPPKPALIENPAVAYQPGTGVRLTWMVAGSTKSLTGFVLTRGDEKFGETQCRSCSDFYQPLANPDLKQASVAKGKKYQYVDKTVEGGWRYYYQIAPSYRNGAIGQPVQISVDVE
jgi:hypothetical protein